MVGIMEDATYESADSMAKDIIKAIGVEFAKREWYAYVHRWTASGMQIAWGPLSSDAEVARLHKKAALGGDNISLKLYSAGSLLARLDESSPSKHCTSCQHPHGAHEHPQMGGRCAVRGCQCQLDTK